VAPTRTVGTSASITFPCSIKIQKTEEVGKPSLNAAQPYAKAEGRVFLLVPAYLGCPETKAVKRLLLLLLTDRETDGQTDTTNIGKNSQHLMHSMQPKIIIITVLIKTIHKTTVYGASLTPPLSDFGHSNCHKT